MRKILIKRLNKLVGSVVKKEHLISEISCSLSTSRHSIKDTQDNCATGVYGSLFMEVFYEYIDLFKVKITGFNVIGGMSEADILVRELVSLQERLSIILDTGMYTPVIEELQEKRIAEINQKLDSCSYEPMLDVA